MKKTLGSLTIDDKVYSQKNLEPVKEWFVKSIDKYYIYFETKSEYDRIASRKKEDLTAFRFVGKKERDDTNYYDLDFFTEKLDALKKYRDNLDKNIENKYKQQEDFLQQIKSINNIIRKVDLEIAKELKK